jgi:hypothetical protein
MIKKQGFFEINTGSTKAVRLRSLPLLPSRLCRLRRDLGPLTSPKFGSAGDTTLQATKTAQGDGMGILSRIDYRFRQLVRFILRNLARGFKHDLVCEFVGITRAGAF